MIIIIGLTEKSRVEKGVRQGEGGLLAGLYPSLELNTFHQERLRGQKILLSLIESAQVLLLGNELLLGI
jgi:hypothetical protein